MTEFEQKDEQVVTPRDDTEIVTDEDGQQQASPAPTEKEDAEKTDQPEAEQETPDGEEEKTAVEQTEKSEREIELEKRLAKIENDNKAAAGKMSKLESQNVRNDLIQKTVGNLYSADNQEKFGAIARIAEDRELYEDVQKFSPDLRGVPYESFLAEIQRSPQKSTIEQSQQIERVKAQAQQDVKKAQQDREAQEFTIRQQVRLESRVPEYAKTVGANPQLATQELTIAMNNVSNKVQYMDSQGVQVTNQQIDDMIAQELVSLNPKYQQIKASASVTKDIKSAVRGAVTGTPSGNNNQLTEAEHDIYEDHKNTLIGMGVDPNEAHKEAMNLFN